MAVGAGDAALPPAPGVSGRAWFGFGRDAQHSALGAIATQDLNRIAWSTSVDLAPQYSAGGALLIHYGSPVVTSNNTVVVPVKRGATGGTARARVSDDSTASPTVGPDGKVYFGVLENILGSHNARGWLLQFNALLAPLGPPGGFGWDDTASIVPASMVITYNGGSDYLLMVKYNNYLGVGSGDGVNRIAVIDPNASQTDAISGLPVMREVLSIAGTTLETGSTTAVKEWCINSAAVDRATKSILANSEDGYLYRWSLSSNTFTQRIELTSGIAEAYTPTVVGADGAVYAVNNAVLFSIAR